MRTVELPRVSATAPGRSCKSRIPAAAALYPAYWVAASDSRPVALSSAAPNARTIGAARFGPESPMRYPDQEGESAMAEKKTEVYSAEYMGSGTFRISKPKRKPSKLKEIRSKRNRRRARRN